MLQHTYYGSISCFLACFFLDCTYLRAGGGNGGGGSGVFCLEMVRKNCSYIAIVNDFLNFVQKTAHFIIF